MASRRKVIRLPHLQQLLAVDSMQELSATKQSLVYVGGWFLVHTMARFYPGRLAKILARMADGDSFDHAVVATLGPGAWNELSQHYEQAVYDHVAIARRREHGRAVQG